MELVSNKNLKAIIMTKLEDLKDEMGSKASMIVQSNLSDMLMDHDTLKTRVNFVKFIVNITDGDLNVRLNSNRLTDAFFSTL